MTTRRFTSAEARARIVRQAIGCDAAGRTRYTIATLVTDHAQYDAMRASLHSGGFDRDCEYLHIDNSLGEQVCAYAGLDAMLSEAAGEYVILCHQDIRLLDDDRRNLDRRLAELHDIDPLWAVAGNAGGVGPGVLAIRITDPHGADQYLGTLPQRVVSLDENFIIVRREARFSFSRDLSGFHLYGADLCLNADIAGWHAYVIDFHLAHLSGGRKDASFTRMEEAFRARWAEALRPRWMQTTCTLLHIAGTPIARLAGGVAKWPVGRVRRALQKRALAGSQRPVERVS